MCTHHLRVLPFDRAECLEVDETDETFLETEAVFLVGTAKYCIEAEDSRLEIVDGFLSP